MNINEYEEHYVEGQQQEASLVSQCEDIDQSTVLLPPPEANQCEFLAYDKFSDGEEDIITSVLGGPFYPQPEDYESMITTVSRPYIISLIYYHSCVL